MRALSAICLLLAGTLACNFDTSTEASPTDQNPIVDESDASPEPFFDAGQEPIGPDAMLLPDAAPTYLRRINVNGPAHEGVDFPGSWEADPGSGGVCSPQYYTNNNVSFQNTVDDALFTNISYGSTASCAIGDQSLPAGNYRLRLYFAEIYFGCVVSGGSGRRVFDISVEGNLVEDDFDIFDLVGGCAGNVATPHVTTYDLAITDGTLNIDMQVSSGFTMVSAIELQSLF